MRIILGLCSIFILAVFSCNHPAAILHTVTPPDTLSYEQQIVNKSYNGCDPDSVQCTYIEYLFPIFTNANKPLSDSLSKCMLTMIGGENSLQQSIYLLVDSFIQQYDNMRHEFPEDSRNWEKQCVIEVVSQNADWVCLSYNEYAFTGGAHGNSFSTYSILSKKNGAQLKINDLFTSKEIQQLKPAAEQLFRKKFDLNTAANLDSAGFWFGEKGFYFSNNFYVTDSAIHFVYNQYEIAPYSMGLIELSVPYSDFK